MELTSHKSPCAPTPLQIQIQRWSLQKTT